MLNHNKTCADFHLNRKLELRFGVMLKRKLWALGYKAVTVLPVEARQSAESSCQQP